MVLPAPATPRRAVNLRSVFLGLAGVVFICALTPFNNYAMQNTDLIGSFLAVGVLLFMLVVIVLVNAPLRRFAPHRALAGRELAVAMGMMLVSCALPSVGLMRYLPGHLVTVLRESSNDGQVAQLVRDLDLPDWMLPQTPGTPSIDPAERGSDPVIVDFSTRIPLPENSTFLHRFFAVPWHAWLKPFIAWGIFFGAIWGMVICLAVIFRRQWVENERLAFPLATVFVALIESPPPGRSFNDLLRSRGFQMAFGAVLLAQSWNALSLYLPRYIAPLPLSYNIEAVTASPPWSYIELAFKDQQVYFTIIGITFFLQSSLAFSLWFAFIAVQVARMALGAHQAEITPPMTLDQTWGALVVLGATILWIARRHLSAVVAQMFRRPREGEPVGRYLPYALAGWGALGCMIVAMAWLTLAGASLAGAVVIVLLLALVYLVLARVVAETGLTYVLLPTPYVRPWLYLLADLPQAMRVRTTLGTYFFSAFIHDMTAHDTRESMIVYAQHALRVSDQTNAFDGEFDGGRRGAARFMLALVLAIAVAYVTAGVSYLYVDYSYASTLDRPPIAPINWWGAAQQPRDLVLRATLNYEPPRTGPSESHDRLKNVGIGAGITAALSILRLRFAGWPIHPVGYLLCYSWGMRSIWFSIFLGWLAKVVIVRFGGAGLYRAARNVFIGLILGEAAAAALWLCVSLVRLAMGLNYQAVRLLPV